MSEISDASIKSASFSTLFISAFLSSNSKTFSESFVGTRIETISETAAASIRVLSLALSLPAEDLESKTKSITSSDSILGTLSKESLSISTLLIIEIPDSISLFNFICDSETNLISGSEKSMSNSETSELLLMS